MSAEKLAILLSECEKDTPKYVLISHELSLRIVKEQNKTTYYAIAFGIIGIVLGWLLTQWQPFAKDIVCPYHVQSHAETSSPTDKNNKILTMESKDLSVAPRSLINPPITETATPIEQMKSDDAEKPKEKDKEQK